MKVHLNYRSIAAVATSTAAVILVILACMAGGERASAGDAVPLESVSAQAEEASQPAAAPRETYTLKEYKGDICVFTSDSGTEPEIITSIDISTLRKADMDMLKEGITVDSFEALLMLLEDLGS